MIKIFGKIKFMIFFTNTDIFQANTLFVEHPVYVYVYTLCIL